MQLKRRVWIHNNDSNSIQNGCGGTELKAEFIDKHEQKVVILPTELKTKRKYMRLLVILFDVQQDKLKLV